MSMDRREAVAGLGALLLSRGFATPAWAASYPDKPIRLMAPFPPGGTGDVIVRPLCDKLSAELGRPVVPEYVAGAGGTLAAEKAAVTPPDGYTLLVASTGAFATGPHIARVRYDPIKGFAPISQVAASQYALVVTSASPISSVADLVSRAKAQPGKLTYGSPGVGSLGHLAGELLRSMTGAEIVHVAYRGQSAMDIDLYGGRIDMAFAGLGGTVQAIADGRLRALAVTGDRRPGVLPNVPTMAEAGVPGYAAVVFWGVVAPAGTPPDIVRKLNASIEHAVAQPALRQLWSQQGQDPVSGTPEAFGALISSEYAKWAGIVQNAHISQQ